MYEKSLVSWAYFVSLDGFFHFKTDLAAPESLQHYLEAGKSLWRIKLIKWKWEMFGWQVVEVNFGGKRTGESFQIEYPYCINELQSTFFYSVNLLFPMQTVCVIQWKFSTYWIYLIVFKIRSVALQKYKPVVFDNM